MKHTRRARKNSEQHTPLTGAMIDACPAVDIHVHVQGTVAPQTAWELGIRNGLITVSRGTDGVWKFKEGPRSLDKRDPVKNYSNIFCSKGGFPISLDESGKPIDLEYNFNCVGGGHDKFTGFDAVMATVQGHRHPPGGIQTEKDYCFVMQRYLESCRKQNIRYTEALQNIHIAHVLYPGIPEEERRTKFFHLCQKIVKDFADGGVQLRFHHCPNKTSKSNHPEALEKRSLEWPKWLAEAGKAAPGVFVALNSAGHEQHEKDEGGPQAMTRAYTQARDAGFGCEAHGGEGIGVEHMVATMRALPVSRIAHGVQAIESPGAIAEVKKKNITLVMMPYINVTLGTPLHMLGDSPHAKLRPDGSRDPMVHTKHIPDLASHPFFPLLREHKLPIALATDNPEMGGDSYKSQIRKLAGLDPDHPFHEGFRPLSAEELALCNLNAINAAFCDAAVKKNLVQGLAQWMKKYDIHVLHPLLEPFKERLPRQQDSGAGGFTGL